MRTEKLIEVAALAHAVHVLDATTSGSATRAVEKELEYRLAVLVEDMFGTEAAATGGRFGMLRLRLLHLSANQMHPDAVYDTILKWEERS